jgi:ubiquinone/menaquinone biosynthesis C-methylase UbiE
VRTKISIHVLATHSKEAEIEKFYRSEPFFAVLMEPRFRSAAFDPAARDAFIRSGEEYVQLLFDLIARVTSNRRFDLALELGCGPGRVAIPLARRCRSLVATDVSDAMLEAGRNLASSLKITNITFARSNEMSDDTFDLVNCSLLLQTVEHRAGLALLSYAADRVASGGVLAIDFPTRLRVSSAKRVTRFMRQRLSPLNAIANRLLGKDQSTPFIPTTVYTFEEVSALLASRGFADLVIHTERHSDSDRVILVARRAGEEAAARSAPAPVPAVIEEHPDSLIRPEDIIAASSVDELNQLAERYFASLSDWNFHLAKPFSSISDTPPILMNVAVLLQGLRFRPGQTILDFGAGTGWLSRILAQLGARAIACDVSSSALKIAAETFRIHPPAGVTEPPVFLQFDGVRIDLPDESVERVICFDSFHHVPDPEVVLREFGRILKPGGLAAFAEPGPHHSESAQSQFEMRNYGVLENDVDVHAIWRLAQEFGFVDLRMAVFSIPPFHVTLEEFDDLLAGGASLVKWAEAGRESLANTRNFFLTKAGHEVADSRSADGLRSSIEVLASRPVTGATEFDVLVTNRGTSTWLATAEGTGGVAVGAHVYDARNMMVRFDAARGSIRDRVAPGASVPVTVTVPDIPGAAWLEFDCVAERVTWFALHGSEPARVRASN